MKLAGTQVWLEPGGHRGVRSKMGKGVGSWGEGGGRVGPP